MLYLHYNEDFTFISFILFFCRVDSWCKLAFNYGKSTVNMFYDYDYDYDSFWVGAYPRGGRIRGTYCIQLSDTCIVKNMLSKLLFSIAVKEQCKQHQCISRSLSSPVVGGLFERGGY